MSCDSLLKSIGLTPMSVFRKLIFSDLCLNHVVLDLNSDVAVNECDLYPLRGR